MYDNYENGECTIDQIGGHVIRFIILTQPLALGHIVATMNPGPLENLGTQPKEKLSKKWEKYKSGGKAKTLVIFWFSLSMTCYSQSEGCILKVNFILDA